VALRTEAEFALRKPRSADEYRKWCSRGRRSDTNAKIRLKAIPHAKVGHRDAELVLGITLMRIAGRVCDHRSAETAIVCRQFNLHARRQRRMHCQNNLKADWPGEFTNYQSSNRVFPPGGIFTHTRLGRSWTASMLRNAWSKAMASSTFRTGILEWHDPSSGDGSAVRFRSPVYKLPQ